MKRHIKPILVSLIFLFFLVSPIKQAHANENFVFPAGYLPNVAPFEIFGHYENLRSGKFSHSAPLASGYEYYYMVEQSPEAVKGSAIAGKIKGVHAPWTHLESSEKLQTKLIGLILFHPKISGSPDKILENTINFTNTIGGQYIVIHSVDLDPNHPEASLQQAVEKAITNRIRIVIEPDLKTPDPAQPQWVWDHVALFKKFNHPIVFDPATAKRHGQDPRKVWQELGNLSNGNINNVIGHIHTNDWDPKNKIDQIVPKTDEFAQLYAEIENSGYNGYINFEIGPVQNQLDEYRSIVFVIASLLRLPRLFPQIYDLYSLRTSQYITESIMFAQNTFQSM